MRIRVPRELQQRILGNLIGYFTTEIGMLNQSVHLWGYTSLGRPGPPVAPR